MIPYYDLDKIKFSVDKPSYEKAVDLYESGKVTKFKEDYNGFSAIVYGTKPYRVIISNHYFDKGLCDCYLGQRQILCKHMIAVAIRAIMNGKKLSYEDKEIIEGPICSGDLGELNEEELKDVKTRITFSIKYIKGYRGPSKTWFAYQNSLDEGVGRLSKLVSELPVSEHTFKT
jgi:hypothetical protein